MILDPYFTLVIGIGVVGFLFLKIMEGLDDEKHWHLKLVILFFVLSLTLLVPKAVIDSQKTCEVVINKTTLTNNVTTYEYGQSCILRDETTPFSFLKRTQVMYYLVIGYSIVALMFWALIRLYDSWRKRGGGRR